MEDDKNQSQQLSKEQGACVWNKTQVWPGSGDSSATVPKREVSGAEKDKEGKGRGEVWHRLALLASMFLVLEKELRSFFICQGEPRQIWPSNQAFQKENRVRNKDAYTQKGAISPKVPR